MFAHMLYVNAEGDCPSGEDRRCLASVFRRTTEMLALTSHVNGEAVKPAGASPQTLTYLVNDKKR